MDKELTFEEMGINEEPLLKTGEPMRFSDFLFCAVLTIFMISVNGIQKFPVLLIVNKLSGVLLILLSLVYVRKFYVSSTLKILFIFIVVTFITSIFVAKNSDRVADMTLQLVQLFILLVCVSQFFIFKSDPKYLLIALVINSIFLIVAGNFMNADVVYSGSKIERYSSITSNANLFAFQMLLGFISVLYFWRNSNLIIQIFIIGISIYLLYNISISGSRKSLICYGIIFLAWLYYSFPIRKSIMYFTLLAMIGIFAGSYILSAFADTAVMQRFIHLQSNHDASDMRASLYVEAFKAFSNNPVFGVGMDNFRLYSTSGLYAHSNYMEILADLGIIGFIIYYFIYVKVWLSSNKISQFNVSSEDAKFLSGVFKIIIVLYLIIGFGTVLYSNITHWMMLLFPIIIYETGVQQLKQQQQVEMELEMAASEVDFRL